MICKMTNKKIIKQAVDSPIKDDLFLYNPIYHMNRDFFSYSELFDKKQTTEKINNVNILDEQGNVLFTNISDNSIRTFISHCQHQNYHVAREEAINLYFLTKRYGVTSLNKELEDYFSNFSNDTLIQFLIKIDDTQNSNLDDYEEAISNNLVEFIEDDIMLLIPIPFMYKILEKYFVNHSKKLISNHQIIEFLFKYLSRYGRKASILFSFIYFGNDELKYLNQLLTEYPKTFDFNFINTKIIKELVQKEQTEHNKEKENSKMIEIIQEQMKNNQNEIVGLKVIIFALFISLFLLLFLFLFHSQFKLLNVDKNCTQIKQSLAKETFLKEELIRRIVDLEYEFELYKNINQAMSKLFV